MAQANIKAVITAEDRASKVIRGVDDSIGGLSHTIGKTLRAGALAGVAALGGLTAWTWKSVEAFAEEELAVTRLQAGIKNVTSATDKNVQSLINQASALQKVTRFSDEQIISAQGILTTFQLNQEAIELLTPRLIDMAEGIARVGGEMPDLEGNAILVAKALGGEDIAGLAGALRRVGVIMTSTQQEILNTGTQSERLAIITQILDQNFRGMGEAAGTTASGKMIQLKNSVNDLMETFGAAIFDAIKPFIATLTEWAQSDQARETIRQISARLGEVIQAVFVFLRDHWPGIRNAFITFANLASDVAGALGAVIGSIQWIINNSKKLSDALNPLGGGFSFSGLLKGVGSLLPGFQHGTSFAPGGMSLVGERGPELVNLPRGSQVIPNDRISSVGSVNITIQAGAFMGSQLEARKYAEMIMEAYKDLASSKSMTASQMLGA